MENSESSSGKPIYALGEIKWGAFRDVDERIGKYWLWGPLKPYAAYFFGAFKSLTWNCSSTFRYTSPCDGCNNCMRSNDSISDIRLNSGQGSRWWQAFMPRPKPVVGNISFGDVNQISEYILFFFLFLISQGAKTKIDYSKITNPECNVWHQTDFSTVEFQALTENNLSFTQPNHPRHLEINICNCF